MDVLYKADSSYLSCHLILLIFFLHIFISDRVSSFCELRVVEAFYTDVIDIGQRLLECQATVLLLKKEILSSKCLKVRQCTISFPLILKTWGKKVSQTGLNWHVIRIIIKSFWSHLWSRKLLDLIVGRYYYKNE